jgi:cytochrome c biogenesis protein CcmG/thiol:disulfide interchange protein DsbE
MRNRAPALAGVAIALVLAGLVVLLVRGSAPSTGEADGQVVAAGAPDPGQPAPMFAGPTVGGGHVDTRDLRGRPVLVNFFATWCTPCRTELPLLESAQRSHPGITFVAVNYRETGDPRAMLATAGVTFTALLDADSDIGGAYRVTDVPVTALIDAQGRVITVFRGQLSPESLDSLLSRAGATPGRASQ